MTNETTHARPVSTPPGFLASSLRVFDLSLANFLSSTESGKALTVWAAPD